MPTPRRILVIDGQREPGLYAAVGGPYQQPVATHAAQGIGYHGQREPGLLVHGVFLELEVYLLHRDPECRAVHCCSKDTWIQPQLI